MKKVIKIGLTTWSEHGHLFQKNQLTLAEYASTFPVVEVDTFFYAIPHPDTVKKWVEQTPDSFKFIVKAHQAMTLHRSWSDFFESEKEMYVRYQAAISPLKDSGKLAAILFQFPPTFRCETASLVYLKRLKRICGKLPVAVEFRHQSWLSPEYKDKTIAFLTYHYLTLVTVDEPQVPDESVPYMPVTTTKTTGVVRLHGRSLEGWQRKDEDWRKFRTLYRYNERELASLQKDFIKMAQEVESLYVIFNNNSGGDAGVNALNVIESMKLEYHDLHPKQTTLF